MCFWRSILRVDICPTDEKMSHWYDFSHIFNRLERIKKELKYTYRHQGESLTVFDDFGVVIRLSSLDKAMDFARVVESVIKIKEKQLLQEMTEDL
jgi:hypothetical protein